MQHSSLMLTALVAGITTLVAGCGQPTTTTVTQSPPPSSSSPTTTQQNCYVELFDGDKFKDDSALLRGPIELAQLDHIPGATKDWKNEADSLKVGNQTRLTTWTKENFEGESRVFQAGNQIESLDKDIASLRIDCE